MNDLITVGIVLDGNELSAAAVGYDEFEIKRVMGTGTILLNSRTELPNAVVPLLNIVEENADIMIRNVVCHDVDRSPEDSEVLAEITQRVGCEAIPVYVNFRYADDLASWWADRQ